MVLFFFGIVKSHFNDLGVSLCTNAKHGEAFVTPVLKSPFSFRAYSYLNYVKMLSHCKMMLQHKFFLI